MADRTVEGQPRALPTMLKAALPVLPGLNLIPGVAKRGNALPDLTLHRKDAAIDRDHVSAYAEVCGFEPSQTLPFTYPHLLAFPLHMGIMTDSSFPFPAIGTVHVGNTITRHRPIAPSERLDVSATAVNLRPHPKGRVFDLVTTVHSAGEPVWEETSTFLRRGRGESEQGGDAARGRVEGYRDEQDGERQQPWILDQVHHGSGPFHASSASSAASAVSMKPSGQRNSSW